MPSLPPNSDLPLRLLLAPLLAAQAISVRRSARFLPEPSGPRSGTLGDGPPLRLLITGDSSAAGVGAPTQDLALSGQLVARLAETFRVSWHLYARTGHTTADTLAMLNALPKTRCDIAVTALGVNDVTRATTTRRWQKRQTHLLDLLRTRFGVAHSFVTGLPPMGLFPLLPQPLAWVLGAQATRFDKALENITKSHADAHHVRVSYPLDPDLSAADGYHPTPKAYGLWAQEMAAQITTHWPTSPRP
ncbi:MAG: SGNH/GDSL hydrolase family protein [Sedimentitalea sp.]